jgi:hypothetical protein
VALSPLADGLRFAYGRVGFAVGGFLGEPQRPQLSHVFEIRCLGSVVLGHSCRGIYLAKALELNFSRVGLPRFAHAGAS